MHPFIAQEDSGSETLLLTEQAYHASPEALARMSETEREIIKIGKLYSEKALMKNFSKEQVYNKFLKRLTEETLSLQIRPYIEQQLRKVIDLICLHNIPFYQNSSGNKTLYHHHRIEVLPCEDEVSFHFRKDEQTFSYSMTFYQEMKEVAIREKKPVVVLSVNPAVLLLNNELHRFREISAQRLLPFTKKKEVTADAARTAKYLETVVLPILLHHEIEAEGLPLFREERTLQPLLMLSHNAEGQWQLKLEFRYGDRTFSPDGKYKFAYLTKREQKTEIYYFYRDVEGEKRVIDALLEAKIKQKENGLFGVDKRSSDKDATKWMTTYKDLFERYNIQLKIGNRETELCLDDIHISKKVYEKRDWFDLHITVQIGEFDIPFIQFKRNILKKKKEFVLPNGKVVLLPKEWFTQYADLLEFGEKDREGILIKRTHVGVVNATFGNQATETLSKHPFEKEKVPPRELKANLRYYQMTGFNWMLSLHHYRLGGCLADDMGLGKTLQTLALLQHLYTENKQRPATLIVVPTSLLHNWRKEIAKFTRLSSYEFTNASVSDTEQLQRLIERHSIVLISYGMMRNNIRELEKHAFEYVVLDESQNIKNCDSATFRAAVRLKSSYRLALTGTPIENSLKDLWSQFHFLQPGLLGNEREFNTHYITPIKEGDKQTEQKLRNLISPYILRRNKEEVAPELPPLTEEVVFCEMEEQQRSIYTQEKSGLRNVLLEVSSSKKRHTNLTVLNGITKLRQLACHPQMVMEEFNEKSGKLEEIMSVFETLQSGGHKVLIFSSFVKHLELIATALEQQGYSYTMLTGKTTRREEEIERFSNRESIQAFLISLKAGGVGLNLIKADYVFIIDPWWNPAAEMQAIARAHRIGQSKQVFVYRFITKESIEEKILQLQDEKLRLSKTFISESSALRTLTDKEWANLLEE